MDYGERDGRKTSNWIPLSERVLCVFFHLSRGACIGKITFRKCTYIYFSFFSRLIKIYRYITKTLLWKTSTISRGVQPPTDKLAPILFCFNCFLEALKFELQKKVGWVLKSSGNSLLNGHWDYPFWTKGRWENQVWSDLPYFEKSSPKPTFIYTISHPKLGLGLKGQSTLIFE